MDLTAQHDNIDLGKITETAGKVVTAVKDSGLIKGIRDKAKAKKAQKISDAGGYFTLTAYQKSLISVPDYAKTQASQSGNVVSGAAGQPLVNASGQIDIAQAPALPATNEQLMSTFKKALPYIVVVIAAVVLLFFIGRRK